MVTVTSVMSSIDGLVTSCLALSVGQTLVMSSYQVKESVTFAAAVGHTDTMVVVNDDFHFISDELVEIHSGAASHKGEKNNAHFHVDVFETDVSMILLNKCLRL